MRRVIHRQVTTIKIVSITLTWAEDDDIPPHPAAPGGLLVLPEAEPKGPPETDESGAPGQANRTKPRTAPPAGATDTNPEN